MLKVVIVEDELHSRETLKNLLMEFCQPVEIMALSRNVEEAVSDIRTQQPDLIFLDVELQTGTGFDVLTQLKDMQFDVIFTTAFDHYAVKAIKYSSLDYLLKPIDIEELQQAMAKAILRKGEQTQREKMDVLLSNLSSGSGRRKICLATADSVEFINVNDIIYCEANGSYTNFHFIGGRQLLVSKHLKEYENLLMECNFMRVHNSYLINLGEVKKFVKSDGGYIVMNNDITITISQKKREEFMERMTALS
jgi:two-component system, LytTR family, response regulator